MTEQIIHCPRHMLRQLTLGEIVHRETADTLYSLLFEGDEEGVTAVSMLRFPIDVTSAGSCDIARDTVLLLTCEKMVPSYRRPRPWPAAIVAECRIELATMLMEVGRLTGHDRMELAELLTPT